MPRIASHHLHWHWPKYQFDNSPTMKWLFMMRFFRDVVGHITTFFVPIYIYQQVSERELLSFLPGSRMQQGLVGIALFFLVYRAMSLVSAIPLATVGTRFGHVWSLVLSHILLGGHLALLFGSQWHPWLLLVAAAVEGLQVAIFWPTYQTLIAQVAQKNRMGEDLGLIQFLIRLASLVSPALGGLIIVFFGFPVVFLVGLVGVGLSLLAVLHMHFQPEQDTVSLAELQTWLREKTFSKLAITYFGRYLNDAVLALWPVYIFLFLGTVDRVGYLYTFSLFIAMVLSFAAGFYIDHSTSRKPFFFTGGVLSVLWLLRSQIWSFWHIALINTVERLASDFHWLFYDSAFMRRGKGSQAYSFFVYREVIISLSAVLFWLCVMMLFMFINQAWQSLFILGAIGVLLSIRIEGTYQKNDT